MEKELYHGTLDDDSAWIEDDLNWRRWPWSRKLAMGFALLSGGLLTLVALGAIVFLLLIMINVALGTTQPDGTTISPLTNLLDPLARALCYLTIGVIGSALLAATCVGLWVHGE